jgi:hypothetical protein
VVEPHPFEGDFDLTNVTSDRSHEKSIGSESELEDETMLHESTSFFENTAFDNKEHETTLPSKKDTLRKPSQRLLKKRALKSQPVEQPRKRERASPAKVNPKSKNI